MSVLFALPSLSILQDLIIALVVLGLVYLVLKLSRSLVRIIIGVIVNSLLGFLAILILDYLFNIGIPISSIPVIVSTAIFGLPAVGTLTILKLLGVSLL